MARPRSKLLTAREAEIMQLLWEQGPLSPDQVRAFLPDRPHDSSVRTMLRVLVEKKYARVDRSQRPAVYAPAVSQMSLQGKATRSLLERFFGGSVEDLVQHLLDAEQLTPDQLSRLRRQYVSARKERDR